MEVPEGYAVNFLFPQHLAFVALPEQQEKEAPQKNKKQESEEQKLAADLDGLEVIVAGKTEKGKFTKSLNPKDVRSSLKEMGYKVDEDLIVMSPITEPGNHEIIIEFSTGYEATLTVIAEAL